MKKLTILFLSLAVCLMAKAQTPSDSIKEVYGKIANLENRLSLQDSKINKLMQQVDEVSRQNLALKKNLKLSPTIATAKAKDVKTGEKEIMEFRITEVAGDSTTVHMTIIADNITDKDRSLMLHTYQVVDDQGHGFENSLMKERFKMKIDGEANNLNHALINYPANAPLTIDLYLYEVNPDTQYIKYMTFDFHEMGVHYQFSFENLPIKWNTEVKDND